jgi:CMP-N-acetylneuraminic acid synthetase
VIGNKKVLAIVTARAGSKGIPGKNYRRLLGRPLFIWSYMAAEQSKYVDGVILSTNCKECQKHCCDYLTERAGKSKKLFGWIPRPDEISGDLSKNEDSLIHALDHFKYANFDIVINLQPTSPCRLDGLIDRCIEEYDRGGYDSLLTATKDTPFLWQKVNGKWNYIVDKNDCCNRKMRQEFTEQEFTYHDNGNLYIVESSILLDRECRIGYNPCVFETTGANSLQIDEEHDFLLIEKMLEVLKLESPV